MVYQHVVKVHQPIKTEKRVSRHLREYTRIMDDCLELWHAQAIMFTSKFMRNEVAPFFFGWNVFRVTLTRASNSFINVIRRRDAQCLKRLLVHKDGKARHAVLDTKSFVNALLKRVHGLQEITFVNGWKMHHSKVIEVFNDDTIA
jgi:hypothetical protein